MSKIINLNKARKDKTRAQKKALADANAVKYGRSKAQRLLEATQAEQLRRALDSKKFDEE